MYSVIYEISSCTPEENRMLSEVEKICNKKNFKWDYSSRDNFLFIRAHIFYWKLDLSEHKILLYRKKIHSKGHKIYFQKVDEEFWKLKDAIGFIDAFERAKAKAVNNVKKKPSSNIDRAFRMIERGSQYGQKKSQKI